MEGKEMIELIIFGLIALFIGCSFAIYFLVRSLLRDHNISASKSKKYKYDKVIVHYFINSAAKFIYPLSITLIIFGVALFIRQVFYQMLFPFSIEALYLAYEANIFTYIFIGVIGLLISKLIFKKTNPTFNNAISPPPIPRITDKSRLEKARGNNRQNNVIRKRNMYNAR